MKTDSVIELAILGLPKTGTTWLEQVFGSSDHVTLFDERHKIETLWQRKGNTGVLVAESATDPLALGALEKRKSALAALFGRLRPRRAVVILRDPADWAISLYRQYVKTGGRRTLQDALHTGEGAILDPNFFDYGLLQRELQETTDCPIWFGSFGSLLDSPYGFLESLLEGTLDPKLASIVKKSIPPEIMENRANIGLKGPGSRILRRMNALRRTRWNPQGPFPWRGLQKLPWHWLGEGPPDLVDDRDREWINSLCHHHSDWPEWEIAFNKGLLIRTPENKTP